MRGVRDKAARGAAGLLAIGALALLAGCGSTMSSMSSSVGNVFSKSPLDLFSTSSTATQTNAAAPDAPEIQTDIECPGVMIRAGAATLVVGSAGALLAYLVDIEALLGVTSVIVSVVFILLAVGALTVRRTPHAGWHMPLWPLAPVVVIGALGYALVGSAAVDLVITGAIVVVAFAYELLYLRPRRDERFLVDALEER